MTRFPRRQLFEMEQCMEYISRRFPPGPSMGWGGVGGGEEVELVRGSLWPWCSHNTSQSSKKGQPFRAVLLRTGARLLCPQWAAVGLTAPIPGGWYFALGGSLRQERDWAESCELPTFPAWRWGGGGRSASVLTRGLGHMATPTWVSPGHMWQCSCLCRSDRNEARSMVRCQVRKDSVH